MARKAKVKSKRKVKKPDKPHPDFPLFAHASGQWAKKVKGRIYYFGVWDDPDKALNRWIDEKDAILAGRDRVTEDAESVTVRYLCNSFLTFKQQQVDLGELTQGTFDDYYDYCEQILQFFGPTRIVETLRPNDFAKFKIQLFKPRVTKDSKGKVIRGAKKSKSLKSLTTAMSYCRAVFNYGEKNYLFECSVRRLWGTSFEKPKSTALQM